MLGKKYTLFRKNIGIENPIEINDDVLFACGCFPHMCSEEESAIFIVFPTGNILIAIIHNYEYTLYTEKPVKQGQYPKRYLQWLDDHGFK